MSNVKRIIYSFGLVGLVACLGSIFVNIGIDWFNELVKPSQWIPNIIIPILWSVIYLIAGFVLYNWLKESMPKSTKILFLINGVLNVLWCLLFFTAQFTFVGLITIILNLVFGFYLLIDIKRNKPYYFYALFIYPIWLSIASCLNVAIWILN